jgi:hypothetical protein
MKTKISLLILLAIFINTAIAQIPNQFNYQAIIRNIDGSVMSNEDVTIDIALLQGSVSGTAVFTESYNVTTTAQGLINLQIGSVSDLSTVDWSAEIYFIEISVNGTFMGASQLLSVPFALAAKTAETADYNNLTNQPDLSQYIIDESDPVFEASDAKNITATDINNWDNKLDAEVDGSTTNEIQTLTLTGNELSLSNGGSVTSTDGIAYSAGDNILIESGVISGISDNDWVEETQFIGGKDSIMFIRARAGGIASNSATLHGFMATTHINLGFNSVTGTNGTSKSYVTISGGNNNQALSNYATVSGGNNNNAEDLYSTVSGGDNNQALDYYTTVSGGELNIAEGNRATISGGGENIVNGEYSTVSGGIKIPLHLNGQQFREVMLILLKVISKHLLYQVKVIIIFLAGIL